MTSATSCGRSSWTAWPQRANTWSWNLPCIWPTVNVRSSPSMLANSNNFGTRRSRNFWLRFSNHPDQYFSDLDRSMRHAYLLMQSKKKLNTHSVWFIEMCGNCVNRTFYPMANDAVAIFPTNWSYPIPNLLILLTDWWIWWRLSLMPNRLEWSALPEAIRLLPICQSQCCWRESNNCNQCISECDGKRKEWPHALNDLSGHRYFGGIDVSNLSAAHTPFDGLLNTFECLWTRSKEALHAGQRFHGRAFDHIDDHATN